jgi:hypothetical protein
MCQSLKIWGGQEVRRRLLIRQNLGGGATSATSIGYQILAKDLSFHIKLSLLLYIKKNWEEFDYIFSKWVESSTS